MFKMSDIIDEKLRQWTQGKSEIDARIAIYNKIREIPYAVIPELNSPERYINIIKLNRGSCTPKHFLLCHMYQRIGLEVLYVVYPFRWDEFEALYPPNLRQLARAIPTSYHLACKVTLDRRLVLIDATIDPSLQKIGLPVNMNWDGQSDTLLAMKPCGAEEIYHPDEASLMPPRIVDKESFEFYNSLNFWLEKIRAS